MFDNIKSVKRDLVVSEDGTKIAMLVRQSKRRGGASFIMQAEFGAKVKQGDAAVQAHAASHAPSSKRQASSEEAPAEKLRTFRSGEILML